MRLAALACVSLFALSACAGGRTAYPVERVQAGDANMSCSEISAELKDMNRRFPNLVAREAGVWHKNAQLTPAVATHGKSALYLMDGSNTHDVELTAAQGRFLHLVNLGNEKRCRMGDASRPVMAPRNNEWPEPDNILYPAWGGYKAPYDTAPPEHPGNSHATWPRHVNPDQPHWGQPDPDDDYRDVPDITADPSVIPPANHMRRPRAKDYDIHEIDSFADMVGTPANEYPVWFDGQYKTRRWMPF